MNQSFALTALCASLAFATTLNAQSPKAIAPPRSFDRVLLLEATSETSGGVSVGDIDRDGDLDVMLAKGRHWPLHNLAMLNDGKGHFTRQAITDSADRTYSTALADLDGDGDLDLVVSNDRPDKKLVYLNDGKGHFKESSTFGDPTWSTRYVTVSDLNGDDRPDLIVANRSSNPENPKPSFVCLNDGKGAFPVCSPLATQSATIIVASDLDGDGKTDLLVPHRDGGQSLIFWNDGTGTFKAPPVHVGPATSTVRAAMAADVDGDGIKDIVVGDANTGLFIYLGQGKRTFGTPVALGTNDARPYSIAIADMNRDGALDIVVGYDEDKGVIYYNQGAGKQLKHPSWACSAGAQCRECRDNRCN